MAILFGLKWYFSQFNVHGDFVHLEMVFIANLFVLK